MYRIHSRLPILHFIDNKGDKEIYILSPRKENKAMLKFQILNSKQEESTFLPLELHLRVLVFFHNLNVKDNPPNAKNICKMF